MNVDFLNAAADLCRPEKRIGIFMLMFVMAVSLNIYMHNPASGQPVNEVAEVTTIAGSKFNGVLTEIASDFIVLTGVSAEKIGFDQIQTIEYARGISTTDTEAIAVELSCNSRFPCRTYSSADGISSMTTTGGLTFTASNRNVDSVRLKPFAESQTLLQQWNEIKSRPPEGGDAVVLRRDGSLETLEGIIKGVTDGNIPFEFDGDVAEVPRSRIDALLYYHASGRELPDPVCRIVLVDGSTIMTRAASVSGDQLELTTTSGCDMAVPAAMVARMDFAMGRVVFLSDLEPVSSDWQPLLANELLVDQLKTLNKPRLGQSFLGDSLTLEFRPEPGLSYINELREFEHGFAMKAGSKIVYSLQGRYERLTGIAGFSPAAISGGNVTLRIRCDDRTVLERHLKKSEMENPLELELEIDDVDRLVFEVDYRDGLAIGDTLHFCDMKVSK